MSAVQFYKFGTYTKVASIINC